MPMAERTLEITFIGNPKPLQNAMQQVENSGGKLQAKISGLSGAFAHAAGTAAGFLGANVVMKGPGVLMGLADTARDLDLQMKKASTVFGDQIPIVQQWAAANARAMGLTKSQAVNLAAGLADLLVPMGMSREEAAALSTKTVGLAGALAEWSGGAKSAAEVSDILTKAYMGETDGLKALGISISAADVSQRLLEKGQQDLTGTARQQAEAIATQEMIFEKSTDAQKAFAEGAGSAARKQAEMTARVQEAKEALALALAPAFAAVTTKLAELVPKVIDFATTLGQELVPRIQAFVEWVKPKLAEFADWAGQQFAKFQQYYQSDIKPALDNIKRGIDEVIAFVREHWPEIERVIRPVLDQVKLIVETTVNSIRLTLGILIDLLGGDFSGAWNKTKELVRTIAEFWGESVKNAIRFIVTLVPTMAQAAVDLANGLKNALMNVDWWNVGSEIIRWLKQGIEDMAWSVIDAVTGIAGKIGDKLNPKNWIGSPQGIQNWFPYYMEQGLQNMEAAVLGSSALQKTSDHIVQTLGKASAQVQTLGKAAAGALANIVDVAPAQTLSGSTGDGRWAPDGRGGVYDTWVFGPRGSGGIEGYWDLVSRAGGGSIAGGAALTVNIQGDVYARNEQEAREAVGDIGYGVSARLRAMGSA